MCWIRRTGCFAPDDTPSEDVKRAQIAAGMPPYMADALAELFAEQKKSKKSRSHRLSQRFLNRSDKAGRALRQGIRTRSPAARTARVRR
jgi:hypothetical protein